MTRKEAIDNIEAVQREFEFYSLPRSQALDVAIRCLSGVDKTIDEIIDKSFCSDILNDRTDLEIVKLDDVLDIVKRSLE